MEILNINGKEIVVPYSHILYLTSNPVISEVTELEGTITPVNAFEQFLKVLGKTDSLDELIGLYQNRIVEAGKYSCKVGEKVYPLTTLSKEMYRTIETFKILSGKDTVSEISVKDMKKFSLKGKVEIACWGSLFDKPTLEYAVIGDKSYWCKGGQTFKDEL
jgi:hypothetical protein